VTIHSSSRSWISGSENTAWCSAFLPRRSTEEPR